VILCLFAALGAWLVRSYARQVRNGGEPAARRHVGERTGGRQLAGAALLLAPALLSILLWQYYPLVKGSVMAFQEYHLIAESPFVGLDNFLMAFTDPRFFRYVLNTFVYVGLSLAFGFLAPIALAVLLAEIPRGSMFFRIVYYLPTMTSSLVVMMLWKLMYDPTEQGLLNQLLASVGVAPQKWLGDARLAMLCIVLPGVWASTGALSIIYLAAMKSLPEEFYEAADLDGAGAMSKLRHVMLPQLKPLIIINFVGAFIGAFHACQNILVMTGGGPEDATMVLGLHIWLQAFMGLNFGYATAMAWILGSVLIGFTVLQLQIMKQVEFRKVEEC